MDVASSESLFPCIQHCLRICAVPTSAHCCLTVFRIWWEWSPRCESLRKGWILANDSRSILEFFRIVGNLKSEANRLAYTVSYLSSALPLDLQLEASLLNTAHGDGPSGQRPCFKEQCSLLLALFLMPETYPPILLARKSRRLLNDTSVSVPRKASRESHGILPSALRVHLVRPFRLLFTQPIIFILSLYFTYSYGLLWLVHSSFYALWTNRYSEPVSISGVNYISLGLGFPQRSSVLLVS